jgi:DNA-binding protein HU-beta
VSYGLILIRKKIMTKDEFLQQIADKAEISKKAAGQVLTTIQEIFESIINSEDKLALPGFLTLGVKERAARKTRNPQTGQTINTPAKKVPYLKVGSKLKAVLDADTVKGKGGAAKAKGKTQ